MFVVDALIHDGDTMENTKVNLYHVKPKLRSNTAKPKLGMVEIKTIKKKGGRLTFKIRLSLNSGDKMRLPSYQMRQGH